MTGDTRTGDRTARALAESLGELGVETLYLGRENSAERIAAIVADERANAVELCMTRGGHVLFLRQLLHELDRIGRRDVSIVVHRVE